MSEPEAPLFNPDSEPEEEALGLKEPLGIIQRFIVPLGANSLTVLDPSIFLHGEIQEESFRSLVQDSPRFQESALAMQGEVQFGKEQTVDRPSAENALGETIQRQESASEDLFEPPSSALDSSRSAPLLVNPTSSVVGDLEIETESSALDSPRSAPLAASPQSPVSGDFEALKSSPIEEELKVAPGGSEIAQSASDLLESSDQSLTLTENPSAESQSVENLLKDSESGTIQAQQIETSEIEQPTEIVQGRSPSTDQRTTRSASQNIPNANVNLQRSSITASEENQTQSPANLEDLGFDASAQTNVGDRKGLDIAQTSTEKEVDRGNAEMIERSQASDPAISPNIDRPIQQQALPSFPEVNPTHPNPIVQAQTYESKIIDAPFDPLIDSPVSSGDPSQSPVAPTSSSLDSSRSAPLAVNPNLPILDVTASDRANEAIDSTDFRAPIADPTIQPLRSDSLVQGEVSTSESPERTNKEPFVPSELSSSQQSIEVGESTPETTVMRSPQPPETSDTISPQVTPLTSPNLEPTLLQPRLIDSASVESESSILPESPNVTLPGIEPQTPLPNDLQADAKGISAQKSADANASSKANPKSLLSKTIQFLSKAAAAIIATPKKQPASEASRQIQSSSVQTDSIQQAEERPSQGLQIQKDQTLSSSPMIAESPLIQPETRSQETLIEQPAQTETRSQDAKTPIQQSTWIESRSTETPIQRSLQLEEQLPEAETPIQSFVQAEGQLSEVESSEQFVQSEPRLPETPIQRSVKADEQSSEALIQPSVQAEGRSLEAEEFSEPSIQPEPLIQHSVQADDLFSKTETSIQRSDRPETQSTEPPIQQLLQSEIGSTEIEIPPQQITQPETRTPKTDFTIQQPAQPETPIQRSIQVEGRSQLETFIEPSDQPETQSAEAENPVQQSAQVNTQSAETFIEESGQAKSQLPETETPIQHSIQTEEQSREPETPIQSSVQPSVQPETLSPEVETLIDQSIQTEERSPEIPIQRSLQPEMRSSESWSEQSAQSESRLPEVLIQASNQAETRSPEAYPVIQRSTQDDTQSPGTETPIQTEIQSTETPIQHPVEIDARSLAIDSPIQQPIQIKGQTQAVESLNEQSIQVEARSTETSVQRSVQADALFSEEAIPIQQSETLSSETPIEQSVQPEEVRSPEVESIEKLIESETRPSEAPIHPSALVEGRSPETEPLIEPSVPTETQLSEIPVQRSVDDETRSTELDPAIQHSIQADARSPEAETPFQPSVQAKEQTPVTETPIQRSIQLEEQLSEAETPIQSSVQIEGRSPDKPIETSFQTDAESPEADPVIQKSTQDDTRSPETDTPIQPSVQTKIQSTETPTQKPIEIDTRSLDIDSPIQRPIQNEGQTQELESVNEQSIQAEARSTETSIQRSVQADALFSEEATPTQQSVQVETLSSETPIEQSIQPEVRSPKVESSIEQAIQVETGSPEAETPIPQPVQVEAQSLAGDSEIQQPEQLDKRSSETPIQASVQTEGRSPETLIEQSVRSEIQSLETPIQASAQAEEPTPEISIQRSIQLSEPLLEAETPIQQSVQSEGRSPEVETPIQQFVQQETRSPETEIPMQRSIQVEGRSPEAEASIEPFAQVETQSPESDPAIQRSTQVEGRSSEALIEQSVPPEMRSAEVETQVEQSIQPGNLFKKSHSSLHSPPSSPTLGVSDLQSPPELGDLGGECNVFATFQTASEMRSPDTSIQRSVQPEGQSPETPIQPSIQPETPLPEAEPSIQETVQIEGRLLTTDSPIQLIVQPPTHETIQPPQSPSSLSQPENNEVASELIASDTEKVQSISPSELAIARETTSEPLAETAIAPYSEFSQLPSVLQNLSILKPLAQNTVQKIPEQSYPSSYPPTVEGKQTQSPSIPGDLGSQRRKLATPQISPQEPVATDSIITVQKSPTQYTKIDIPPRKPKTAEVRSQSTPSIAIAPKTTLQTKRQQSPGVIQMMAQNQTLIPEGKEEIPLETDTSTSDIAQDLETLAQTIYAQLQQRLRIDRERHGHGTGRFPW